MQPAALAGSSGRLARPEGIPVWDPLLRLFHWSLVAAFATAWIGEDSSRIHETAGYVVLALLAFRLVWGFVGPQHARFSDFVASPAKVIDYVRSLFTSHPKRYLGHNPAGAAMVLLLLACLIVTAGSGWLMTTDRFWGTDWVEELHEVAANVALALVVIHVLGVVVSSVLHKENLVRAMITGRKPAA